MTALIFKFNLTEKRYEDNRTIEEVIKTTDPDGGMFMAYNLMFRLLSDVTYKHRDFLYSLSRESIENYLKAQ